VAAGWPPRARRRRSLDASRRVRTRARLAGGAPRESHCPREPCSKPPRVT
jgi:hypothetical protein